jgi:hypothetical protein
MIVVCNTGRFGNQFFINFIQQLLSQKYNLFVQHFRYSNEFKKLGIEFQSHCKDEEKDLTYLMEINDQNIYEFLSNNFVITNRIVFLRDHYQTPQIARLLREYISSEPIKSKIIDSNEFKNRYKSNNDVFVHLRNGDLLEHSNGNLKMNAIEYFDFVLNNINFENGYISTEDFNHETCKFLINKYNLIPYNESKTKTIQFSSTCNHVILSPGTYSWMIGVFSFFSKNIYYCNPSVKWHGDIFIFEDWKQFKL